ncbi:MAG: TetR/AcrR family transcriptional regulator [Myxococcota bacterium]
MTRRIGQHHGELRAALLREALKLLQAGDHSFSLRTLAKRAGVAPSAPYHHFVDREGLFATLATEGFEALRIALDEALDGLESTEQRLPALVSAYIDFAEGHIAHYRVMFQPGLSREKHPNLDSMARRAFSRLAEEVGLVAGKDTDPDEVLGRAAAIWAMAHGVAQLLGDGAFEALEVEDTMSTRASRVALAIARGLAPGADVL